MYVGAITLLYIGVIHNYLKLWARFFPYFYNSHCMLMTESSGDLIQNIQALAVNLELMSKQILGECNVFKYNKTNKLNYRE